MRVKVKGEQADFLIFSDFVEFFEILGFWNFLNFRFSALFEFFGIFSGFFAIIRENLGIIRFFSDLEIFGDF